MVLLFITSLDLQQPSIFNMVLVSPLGDGDYGKIRHHSPFSSLDSDLLHTSPPLQVTDTPKVLRRTQGVSKARKPKQKSRPDISIPWVPQHCLIMKRPLLGLSPCPWPMMMLRLSSSQGPLLSYHLPLPSKGYFPDFDAGPLLEMSFSSLLKSNQSAIFWHGTLLPWVVFFFFLG